MSVPTVFISYSHRNEDYKDRLVVHLKALQLGDSLEEWDDRRIQPGDAWLPEIQAAVERASIAVMLVSADFLASDFIQRQEVPEILERRGKEGLRVISVIVGPCNWQNIGWLAALQVRPKDGVPLGPVNTQQCEEGLRVVAKDISLLIGGISQRLEPTGRFAPLPANAISIGKLPIVTGDLFGRETELEILDGAWADPDTNVVSLIAWGGVGKSALVDHWLQELGRDNYRGAQRVYGWSFYSQGTRDTEGSADEFFDAALRWFGETDPTTIPSPWQKGQKLAQLVSQGRTLLVLDGLEPMQHGPGADAGKLKDQALAALIKELAVANPGLCVITTRLPVADVGSRRHTTAPVIELEHLSDDAGAQLLRSLGVTHGSQEELEQASREFGGHALALTLLGRYLATVYHGDIRHRDQVPPLAHERTQGGHARRVMGSYEKWFEAKPELSILRIMGLFDRPVPPGAYEALTAQPPIPGLTDDLASLSYADRQYALESLREVRLLDRSDQHDPDTLDCHPLVREHFGEKLKADNPEAWQEAHRRLYEYCKTSTKEFPDTLEEMLPLYAAVRHGCEAGLYEEALLEVYVRRIQRGNEAFSTSKLGGFGIGLVAMSGFFNQPWHQPVAELSEDSQAYVLAGVGHYLAAVGRLFESAMLRQKALEARIALADWLNAAASATNLGFIYLTIGDLALAARYGMEGVDLADRSTNAFQRINRRAFLAEVLHQRGQESESKSTFHEAEKIQKEEDPSHPILYALSGFEYCNLLLDREKYSEVGERVSQTIEIARSNQWLLNIALDSLLLGRSYLMKAEAEGTKDFSTPRVYLDQAVEDLRHAGTQVFLPLGLLARAELHRVMEKFEVAHQDLEEVMEIAEYGGMKLYLADGHLEYARLYLAMGEEEPARQHFIQGRDLVNQTGYHRRDGAVAELAAQLGEG